MCCYGSMSRHFPGSMSLLLVRVASMLFCDGVVALCGSTSMRLSVCRGNVLFNCCDSVLMLLGHHKCLRIALRSDRAVCGR